MVAFSIALSGIGWMAGKAATMMGNDAGKSLQPPDDLGKLQYNFLFINS